MTYARVIVNPAAGAGRTARMWNDIKRLLIKSGLRFQHDITEAPGHARELTKLAVKNGHELIVSVGGDGTVNEVVNGLHEAGAMADVSLGIISTGTGRDYMRTFGIPRSYEESCQRLLSQSRHTVDVGMVEFMNDKGTEQRLFVNFAGAGFDSEIVKVNTQTVKALGKTASYLAALFRVLLTYKNKDVSLSIDGKIINERVCTVLLCNGKYGGGGMFTAPRAELNDGRLDVIVIGNLSKPDLLCSLPRIYKGTHLSHPKVTLYKAQEVTISSRTPLALQADGELLGHVPARFSIKPATLKIAV